MSQSLVSCPLCCQPTFSSTNALCLSLISIVSKCLNCPLCEEVLRGLDKLTIHLLSHLLTQTTKNNNGYNFVCQENKCNNVSSIIKPSDNNKLQYAVKKGEQDNSCGVLGNTVISFDKVGAPGLIVDDQVMLLFHNPSTSKNDSVNSCEVTSKGEVYVTGTFNLPQTTSSLHVTREINKKTDDKDYCKQPLDTLYKTEQITTEYNESNGSVIQHSLPCTSATTVENNSLFSNTENRTEFRYSRLAKNITSFSDTDLDDFCNKRCEVDVLKNAPSTEGGTVTSKSSDFCSSAEHVNIHSNNTEPGTNNFVAEGEKPAGVFCKMCFLYFPDKATLSVHESIAHSGSYGSEDANKKLYQCQLCAKAFKMKGSLMVHTRVAHSPGSAAVIAKLVEAKQEGDSPSSSSCGSTPGSPQFNCSTCGKTFKKEYHLLQHEKTHEGKQWECDICFKSFTTKYFLKKHKRLHTGEMPYMCTVCNKSFTFQQSYHKHLLYHNDDKPYSCCDCGRAFKELSTLHNHQRIHTGEKPFSCEHCGKCFRQRVSYLVHRRIHTGAMPYKCWECNKSFRYKVSERTHKCTGLPGASSLKDLSELKDLQYNQTVAEASVVSSDHSPNTSVNETVVGMTLDSSPVYNVKSPKSNKDVKGLLWKNSEIVSLSDPTDFFSLVMSPSTSEKLQNLTLSTDSNKSPINQETSSDNVVESVNDEESLKDLLYTVSCYQ